MIHVLDFSPRPGSGGTSLTRVAREKDVDRLRRSALFADLPAEECDEVLGYASKRTFLRHEEPFSQDQIVGQWILIQSGTVKMTRVTPEGNEVILWISGSGEAISVSVDTVGSRHTCSANAMERCETLVWDGRGVQAVLARHPQIRANISKILAARLRELEERFCEIASEPTPTRVALLVLRLCKSVGNQTRHGIELKLRRQDLAQMTGTTLFTVSRILSKWAALGLLDSRRAGILIRDPERFRAKTCGYEYPQLRRHG